MATPERDDTRERLVRVETKLDVVLEKLDERHERVEARLSEHDEMLAEHDRRLDAHDIKWARLAAIAGAGGGASGTIAVIVSKLLGL